MVKYAEKDTVEMSWSCVKTRLKTHNRIRMCGAPCSFTAQSTLHTEYTVNVCISTNQLSSVVSCFCFF